MKRFFFNYPVEAMVHSQEKDGVQKVILIERVGDNDYIVKTKKGVYCHALFNPFVCHYYADDIFRIEKDYEKTLKHYSNEENLRIVEDILSEKHYGGNDE